MGWNGDYNDPMTFMELFTTGNGYAKFMGGFSDEEFDDLITQAGSSQDDAERLELFGKAEDLLLSKGGVVPLYFAQSQIYVQSYVQNLSRPMFGAEYEFSRVQILAH
jgi:ABC-type oligopeptide transport system substrate-binding subunit